MGQTKRKRKSKEVAKTDDAFTDNDTHSGEPEIEEPESGEQETANFNTQHDDEDEGNNELETQIQELLASKIEELTMPEFFGEQNPVEAETRFLQESSNRDHKLPARSQSGIQKPSSKETEKDKEDIASKNKIETPFTFKIDERMIPKAYDSRETAHIEAQIKFPKDSLINEGPVAPPRSEIHGVHSPQFQGSPYSPSTSFGRIPLIQEMERPAHFQGPLLQQNNHIVMNQIRLPSMPDPRQQGFSQSGDQSFAASQVPGTPGVIGSGYQPIPMYSRPGSMPGPFGPGFIQGQIPPHLSYPGPYRTQSFQMLGSPLRQQGPQNEQLYPPYQPIYYITQNFYGNPGETTHQHHNPGYFQAPTQAPQTNSTRSGTGTATGITPPIGNPLMGDRPAQIVQENNVTPPQPTPLMSLSLEKPEVNKDQNCTTRRKGRRETAPRFQRLKDNTDSKMGKNTSDQVFERYQNPITPMPEEWSEEMITEFSDRIKDLMTIDSESDSTANDKHEPLVVDKTEHEQENERRDHADYKIKQSHYITEAETVLLAQKIEEYNADSARQTSSEERLHEITDYMESSCTQSETNSVETTDGYLLPRVLKERMREVLNNLESPNFDLLVDKISELKIENIRRLRRIANLILIKAISGPRSREKCALLCKKLSQMRVSSNANSNKQHKKAILESDNIPLGEIMIIRCERELKNCIASNERKIQEIQACEDPGRRKLLQKLTKGQRKRRVSCLGANRFLGELFKQELFESSAIIHKCIGHLLGKLDNESLECLCKLFFTVGKKLELEKKDNLDGYFKKIVNIVDNKVPVEVSPAVRRMLLDLIELRKNKWIRKNSDDGTKARDLIEIEDQIMIDEAEHEQENEEDDHDDYKKQSNDLVGAETALLDQKIREHSKISAQQASSKERLDNMPDYMKTSCSNSETKSDETTDEYLTTEALKERMQEVLNNLSSPDFDLLVDEVSMLKIDSMKKLTRMTDLVVQKARSEPSSSAKCALVCKKLSKMKVCSNGNGKGRKKEKPSDHISFASIIILRFNAELKGCIARNAKKIEKIEACADPEEKELLQELTEKEEQRRTRCFRNIRFLGELFHQQVSNRTAIIHNCIDHLLEQIDNESLECLCKLFLTVGKRLEEKKENLDTYFEQIVNIVDNKVPAEVSPRVRFMLADLIELRKNKWMRKNSDDATGMTDLIEIGDESEPDDCSTSAGARSRSVASESQYIADVSERKGRSVAMIFAVFGDCRKDELIKIEITDLKTYHEATDTRKKRPILVVHILDAKTKKNREFEIRGRYYDYYLRYSDLRPDETPHGRFFINFHKGRCTTQPIGERKFAFMPKEIALFLKLPNAESYTGHDSQKTSETFLTESEAEVNAGRQHCGWKSTTVTEPYVENSTVIKEESSGQIPSFFHVNLPSFSIPEDTALRENPVKMENELDLPFEESDNSSGNSSDELNIEKIREQLRTLMSNQKGNPFDNICRWISVNVGERVSEPEFIKVLMTAILEVSIEPYDDTWRFRVDKFHNLQALIPLYVDANIKLSELQCLIAIQEYVHKLKNPQRILLEIVEKQIFESIISFDSSDGSGSDTDITRLTRKSVALLALKSFFSSLYEVDDEM